MILGLSGFPGLQQFNKARQDFFYTSHAEYGPDAVAFWFGHKALTVIALPVNVMGVGIGTTGMVATASTLGALKVAIFALTVGNVKPAFPTGFMWCAERGINAGLQAGVNVGELIHDAANMVYLGYRLIRWVGGALHLEHFFNEIFNKLGEIFEFTRKQILEPVFRFVTQRVRQGISKAIECEGEFKFSYQTPSLIRPLDDLTKENRIEWSSENRFWSKIFKHYVFSVANIPVNAVAATLMGGSASVLSSAFAAKVIVYATTNINIPLPTFAGQALDATVSTTRNALLDIGTDICDSFVVMYKTSSALGINRVMATALQILLYIPEAIFS
jgi:hypothetical protein